MKQSRGRAMKSFRSHQPDKRTRMIGFPRTNDLPFSSELYIEDMMTCCRVVPHRPGSAWKLPATDIAEQWCDSAHGRRVREGESERARRIGTF
jgi:hypothetical protein